MCRAVWRPASGQACGNRPKRTRKSLVTDVLAQEYTTPAGKYLCFQGSSDQILFEDYGGFTMVVSRSSIAKWLFP